ncbi:MAG: ATP-dependent DNA ligase [Thermoproteota archaeon]|nr:ATP-dependent DNA ligase [Thermoproteota archaeon]
MPASEFSHFVDMCEKVRQTASKNAKVAAIAEYLIKLKDQDGGGDTSLAAAVLFMSGAIFPKGSGLTLNVGFNTIMRSLSEIARLEPEEIQKIYLEHGDMGALAEYVVSKRQQSPLMAQQLLLPDLHDQLRKIAGAVGSGAAEAKRKILTGLLINSSPLEAKYLIKIASGELRVGVVEGLVELAIAKAFGRDVQAIRQAMLLSGDIAQVALLAKKDALSTAMMKPLVPLSFMLADVMFSAEEIEQYYNKPLICEFKYDGIRVQLHKFGGKVKMFSRKLEDVATSFPEIVSVMSLLPADFILDGEVLAYRGGRPLHFQELQKRLRRKAVTDRLMAEIPVVYVPYDIMYLNGQPLIGRPLTERKKLLSQIRFRGPVIDLGYRIVSTAQQIACAFKESRDAGHEGLVIKELESQYHPGKRGRHWTKLKYELDTVDAVIVIAEYGHGKRAGTLSDYTFAVLDEHDGGSLKTIGKAYSGLTDAEIAEMTDKLWSITVRDDGYRIVVRPEIVLEVAFDSIQKSDRHNSGFALRFPRIKYIRIDKTVGDIDTLEKVQRIYERQSHLKSR